MWASKVWASPSKSTSGPEACLGERGIQRVAHDHHRASVELANRGGDDVHIHGLAARPDSQALPLRATAPTAFVVPHTASAQQYGHEVLLLGLGEVLAEPLGKVAQLVIQT